MCTHSDTRTPPVFFYFTLTLHASSGEQLPPFSKVFFVPLGIETCPSQIPGEGRSAASSTSSCPLWFPFASRDLQRLRPVPRAAVRRCRRASYTCKSARKLSQPGAAAAVPAAARPAATAITAAAAIAAAASVAASGPAVGCEPKPSRR